jgi:hypothetical protein
MGIPLTKVDTIGGTNHAYPVGHFRGLAISTAPGQWVTSIVRAEPKRCRRHRSASLRGADVGTDPLMTTLAYCLRRMGSGRFAAQHPGNVGNSFSTKSPLPVGFSARLLSAKKHQTILRLLKIVVDRFLASISRNPYPYWFSGHHNVLWQHLRVRRDRRSIRVHTTPLRARKTPPTRPEKPVIQLRLRTVFRRTQSDETKE